MEHRLSSARAYLTLAEKQATVRGRISTLLGNAPRLVPDDTLERCWEMMKLDAESAIKACQEEFDNA
jgi:hypothetical protein